MIPRKVSFQFLSVMVGISKSVQHKQAGENSNGF